MFGPDGVVKLVATPAGVVGLRGAIVDGRTEFEHVDEPSTAADAAVSIRFHVAQQTGLATGDLELNDLRLVAVPRARALGWAASVDRGLVHVATAVVEADPKLTTPHSKLLYFDDDLDEGLADEVPVEVVAEDRESDVIKNPLASTHTKLADGTLLHGSKSGDRVALANERVVAYNAVDANESMDLEGILPFSAAGAAFQAQPGTREFRVQDVYVAAQNFYAWTDRFMAGRWDSHLGADSSFAPGQFSPRLMVYENVGFEFCGEQSFCASVHNIPPEQKELPKEYEQPLGGPAFESLGFFAVEDTTGVSAAILAHEFGHFVDYFAVPGSIATGFGCKNCVPTCEPDTTDESGPLVESFANFAALWLLRDLYAVGQSPTSCAVPIAVSRGDSRLPHVQGCTDGTKAKVALFLPFASPECVGLAKYTCDAPDAGMPRPRPASAPRARDIASTAFIRPCGSPCTPTPATSRRHTPAPRAPRWCPSPRATSSAARSSTRCASTRAPTAASPTTWRPTSPATTARPPIRPSTRSCVTTRSVPATRRRRRCARPAAMASPRAKKPATAPTSAVNRVRHSGTREAL